MAQLPLKPCATAGCRALVRGRPRCEAHTVEKAAERARWDDSARGSFRERGYTSAWDKLRRQLIDEHPTCQVCQVRQSKLVHHVKEVKTSPELLLAPENLVAICASCHQKLHRGTHGRRT